MSFVGVTKNVGKTQKSITSYLSTILIWFFHFWKVDYDSFKEVNLFLLFQWILFYLFSYT